MREPRYKSIVDEFTVRIRSGKLVPGTQLPTTRELMRQYGVALATASRVYAELGEIGLVVGETGRGTFVRDTSLPRTMGLEQRPARSGVIDLGMNNPLLPGQDVFTVSSMRAKLDAQLRGLGGGFLPEPLARPYLESGRLVRRETQRAGRRAVRMSYAWRNVGTLGPGRALQWWLAQLESVTTRAALLERHRDA